MEETKVENALKLYEVKIDNLGIALDKLHSHSSDILLFSLQWRDLKDYLQSAQEKVEKRFLELESKEVEFQNRSFVLEERAKVVEAAAATLSDLEVKADGFKREIQDKEEELGVLRMLLDERTIQHKSKASQLNDTVESLRKTQVELDSRCEQLAQMETDLERHRAQVSAEMEHLARAQTRRREVDEEIERKAKHLTVVQCKVAECGKLLETRSSELTKTQGELDLKVTQLGQMKIDLERHHRELTAEMEHLYRSQTRNRELERDIERKRKDLTSFVDKTAECGKKLQLVEDQLDSQQKLLETRSSELLSKEKELKAISLDLDLREEMVNSLNNEMQETCQKMESKDKELGDIERLIDERSAHYESIKMLIKEHTEELAFQKKRQDEITEEIRKLSLERAKAFTKQLPNKQHSKKDKLGSIKTHLRRCTAEHESTKKELCSVKDTLRECLQNMDIKEKELKSLQSIILTERKKQAEEGEKKIQHFSKSNEELNRQLKVRQEQVCSINKAIRECTGELEAKRKHRDQVQSSITDLTAELKSKECQLDSVKRKIQDSLKDLQCKEDQQVRFKASLMEREQGLEQREKELDAREESIDKKDEQLKFTEQELANWVKDYELKAKQLSNFFQQRNQDQPVALAPRDIQKSTGNSRKRGRYDESLDGAIKSLDTETHVLTSCTTGQENTYYFQNQRSTDKFQIDQVWAIYSNNDQGMPRKYAQIKRIDTSPELKLHVAPLELCRPPPNLMTHPVCCGRFKLKMGKAEVLVPSNFSHQVKAVKSNINRFEVYPRKGEIWALYKNWNITDCAETEELEIVEVVETNEQSIQTMLLTAKVFSKLLYGRCLESMAGFVDIPKSEVNRFSHQIPAFRRERSATRSGDYEWWELDSKALLDLNSKKP